MKGIALVLCLSTISTFALAVEMEETFKRHRGLRHEENRKWSLAKDECHAKYSQGHKASHPDYDKRFHCLEAVEDARQAFENKLKAEICELHKVCRRSPASEGLQ
jgi:hypothetical protein